MATFYLRRLILTFRLRLILLGEICVTYSSAAFMNFYLLARHLYQHALHIQAYIHAGQSNALLTLSSKSVLRIRLVGILRKNSKDSTLRQADAHIASL